MSLNAYFQINAKIDGLYITIYPRVQSGQKLTNIEISTYLVRHGIMEFNKEALTEALLRQDEINEIKETKISDTLMPPMDEEFLLKIADSKMEASVRFYPASEGGKQLSKEDFLRKISEAGVRSGIIVDAVEDWMQNRQYCKDVTIAKGTPPEESKDAVIEYKFDVYKDAKPNVREDGSVDFHDLNLFQLVKAGDVLAVLTPAYHGEPGINVQGKAIPSVRPVNKVLKHGKLVELSEDKCVLTAQASGHVKMESDKVTVYNVYFINGDVGVSTGSIEYDGSVNVSGDVLTGYFIKATGDIFVGGVVESAALEAGGQIVVGQGLHGRAVGTLKAGGNVLAKFIQESTVIAGGSVTSDSILHSKVTADESIVVTSKRGLIIGGELKAGTLISAKVVGSTNVNANTLLMVGVNPALIMELHDLEKKLLEKRSNLNKMRQTADFLKMKKDKGEVLTQNKEKLLKKLLPAQIVALGEDINSLLEQYMQLKTEIDESNSGRITIENTIYEGTKIVIANVSYYVRHSLQKCQFLKNDMEIKVTAYE